MFLRAKICLFFLTIIMRIGGHEGKVTLSQKSSPFEKKEYQAICGHIPDMNDAKFIADIEEAMIYHSNSAAWLPMKRHIFSDWTWLTGEKYGEPISANWKLGENCVVLNVQTGIYIEVPCNRTYPYYMCGSMLPCRITRSYQCFQLNGKTYNIYYGSGSWYAAKQKCAESNENLVTIGRADKTAILHNVSKVFTGPDKVWLGLRKEDYYPLTSDHNDLKLFGWDTDGPCPCPEMKCVIIVNKGNRHIWKPERCDASHKFLCQDENRSRFPNVTTETVANDVPSNKAAKTLAITISVLTTTLALVSLAIGIGVIWYKRRQKNKMTSQRREENELLKRGDQGDDEIVGKMENSKRLRSTKHTNLCEQAVGILEKLKHSSLPKKHPNILILGRPGVGKSSLINSLFTVLNEGGYCEITEYGAGQGGEHITRTLKSFKLFQHLPSDAEQKSYECIPVLWDCPGFQDDGGETTETLLQLLLKGAVPEFTDLRKCLQQGSEQIQRKFQHTSSEEKRIDIIIFVHSAEEELPRNLMGAVMQVVDEEEEKGVKHRIIAVVNKEDQAKREIEKIRDDVSSALRLTRSHLRMHVVSCYCEFKEMTRMDRHQEIDERMCRIWDSILDSAHYQV